MKISLRDEERVLRTWDVLAVTDLGGRLTSAIENAIADAGFRVCGHCTVYGVASIMTTVDGKCLCLSCQNERNPATQKDPEK